MLQSILGSHGIDLLLRFEAVAGVVLGALAFANVAPKAAFAALTPLWSLCLYQLGPFNVYQPDAMLASAGLCAAVIAPPSPRPGLGTGSPPSQLQLYMVWTLLFAIYWGSAVAKLRNPAWRELTIMDHYWESAPVPAWTGWFVQTYLPHKAVMAICAAVLIAETLGPLLLLKAGRCRSAFVWVNLALQLGIALTASYSFLNLLVIGLGMLAVQDPATKPSTSTEVNPTVGRPIRRLLFGGGLPGLYIVASLFVMLPRLIPLSLDPVAFRRASRGPGHLINTYGLYEDIGSTGYRIEIQGSDGTNWYPYALRCLPADERARPRLVWPYQCRLDWWMWRSSKFGVIDDGWFIRAVVRGIARGSTDVASLFDGGAPKGPPMRIRVSLKQYSFATPSEHQLGRWWTTRTIDAREMTPPGRLTPQASAAVSGAWREDE
jgi:hypothetical protein